MTDMLQTVPLLSLAQLSSAAFADAIGGSFTEYGFAMLCDHGMDSDLIARGWDMNRAFFALPEEAKRRYYVEGLAGQRGYTPFRVEIAKGASERDLKEFWHVGRELAPGSPDCTTMPANIWPTEPAGFRDTFTALYDSFEHLGRRVLSGIAVYLGLGPDWFDPAILNGNSILRLLHYPPVAGPTPAIRAGAHEDINLITLLLGAEEAGLQLLTREGDWISVNPPPGAIVVNVGDMLQRLTNHVLRSTTHRVINPAPERASVSRYSMPFFLHLRPDFLIEPLPGCINADNPTLEAPITAQSYLEERLRDIGLM
jgi:isopenicillin N synthase-like dioxygenase